MAAPNWQSVTPDPHVLQPGETIRVTLEATDPDAASGGTTYWAEDAAGNRSEIIVNTKIQDPITYGALDTAKAVLSGDTPEFAAGDLNASLD